ncbi:CPBP family intramembrane glutamic endopeptidase [Tepidibacter hydrothermalis]|uniref:CPBP family intramembrane metalloprotease n=1 Tax=Tepidibacter hydrothermalis TaxID=3036126 RepID=A0ABY8EER7_9FIRM|nr:CPBP family intramembrane glutamic endopeptidase [Tepidibacter hydrothermalis]WFD10084.1 CPBP family intramembrane metalloprotease [Tepidibacter hydrothermalis]
MKIDNFIKKIINRSEYVFISIGLSFICFLILLLTDVIQIFLGMPSLGKFIAATTVLISFILVGKIFFNIHYSGLFEEIKLSKYNCMDNLLITLFCSLVAAFTSVLIYQIDFMINPDVTKSIGYFIEKINNAGDSYMNNPVDVLIFIIWVAIAVAAEEIFFRYTLYKVFVKEKEDVKIFIILSSIIFGLYHFTSIARFFASLTMSIFLGIIYVMTKKLVYSFIAHLLWDYFVSISGSFMGYFEHFNNVNIGIHVFICGFTEVIILCLLILLSGYAYFKRGYILPLKVRNKI